MKRSDFLKNLSVLMVAPAAVLQTDGNKPKFEEEKPIKLQQPKQEHPKRIMVSIYI